jgi:hypothetical protein
LEFVNLVYSRKTVSICGELKPDFDGIGLLGDGFRDATGGGFWLDLGMGELTTHRAPPIASEWPARYLVVECLRAKAGKKE